MKYSDALRKNSSRVLLGTAYFGDTISEETAFEIMDLFYEMGGRHIDTARLYAEGRAEEVVGRWLKNRGHGDMFISSKGAYYDFDAGETPRLDEASVRADLDTSLKALGVDTLDYYWLHRDDEARDVGEIIEYMNALLREGKIQGFGASNWTSARIEKANRYASLHSLHGFSSSQIRFNPAYCKGERGGLVGMDENEFEFYKREKMPVIAYSSQAKGFFSKMVEEGESALSEKAKARYLCDENLSRLETMKKLTKKYNCSMASLICGAFCSFDIPEVFPIIGGKNAEQIKDSLLGADITLEREELREIFKLDI